MPPRRDIVRVNFTFSSKSKEELLKIMKDPTVSERMQGRALQVLADRGIDVRTGKHVGGDKAAKIADDYAEKAPS